MEPTKCILLLLRPPPAKRHTGKDKFQKVVEPQAACDQLTVVCRMCNCDRNVSRLSESHDLMNWWMWTPGNTNQADTTRKAGLAQHSIPLTVL
jgi:hypothetical protein